MSASTRRPVSVEPVKLTLATIGWRTRAPPASPPPVTTLRTPGGKPASRASSASLIAVSDVSGDGYSTTVLPAARAGPSFQEVSSIGKFHGTMAATTPSGSRRV